MTFESELTDKYDLITIFYFDNLLNQLGNNFFSSSTQTWNMNIDHIKYSLNYYRNLIEELWLIVASWLNLSSCYWKEIAT